MEYVEALEALGVEVKEGMDRVMGDGDLYKMMLGMFVEVVEGSPVKLEDFDSSDHDELIKQVHTLKGTTGNLSITPLFEGYKKTLELLRANQPKEAKAAFEKMLPVQSEIVDCIKSHSGAAE